MGRFLKEKEHWGQIFLWVTLFLITAILVTLCFDQGLDLDEAYGYMTIRGNNLLGISRDILAAKDTDEPIYYYVMYLWTRVFGESFFACRLFSVAGTVASMLLGVTVIRRIWGNRTSFLFLLLNSLTPAMIHVGINIRMYSWTVFLITLCALEMYFLAQDPGRGRLWVALGFTTFVSLLTHYFTAFSFLFLYLWLLFEMLRRKQKGIWKLFLCGGIPLVPMVAWVVASGVLQYVNEEVSVDTGKVDWGDFFYFLFYTRLEYCVWLGIGICLMALFALLCLRKRYEGLEWRFVLLGLLIMPCSYGGAGVMASIGSHFFTPRHIMHSVGLLWLALAIILSRVNLPAYGFGILFTVVAASASYQKEYTFSRDTVPYLEDTMKFIEDNFESGDIVIYDAIERFYMLYSCYLPEEVKFQSLWHTDDLTEVLQENGGARIWFFRSGDNWFPPEVTEQFDITYENLGHYGFQDMDGNTDFDLLWLEIRSVVE